MQPPEPTVVVRLSLLQRVADYIAANPCPNVAAGVAFQLVADLQAAVAEAGRAAEALDQAAEDEGG